MILIQTYNPKAVTRLLPDAGISPQQVIFASDLNNTPLSGVNVIVKVGGQGIHHTHCYIQQHYSIPIISCLDPAGIHKDEMVRVFINIALSKAAAIDRGEAAPHKLSKDAIHIATNVENVQYYFITWALLADLVSVDIECDPSTNELTCIGFATKSGALVIPLQHESTRYWSEEDEPKIWLMIAKLLATDTPKLFQNYIFDCMILSKLGIKVNGPIYDTMTLQHLIQPEWPKGLADLARIYLYCDVWKTLPDYTSNHNLWQYNGRDVIYTLMIHEAQLRLLAEDSKRLDFYHKQLVPLHREVLQICEHGLNVDKEALQQLTQQTTQKVTQLLTELQAEAAKIMPPKINYVLRKGSKKPGAVYVRDGTHTYEPISEADLESVKMLKKLPYPVYEQQIDNSPFNPSSPLQVKELIAAMGHKVPSKKGKDTTDELALKKLMLKTKEPIYKQLLDYREASKLLSTYCNMTLDNDGRLRFAITVPGTVTPRFSSKKTPWDTGCNIQNTPPEFRHIIIPDSPDQVFLNVDFKQADPHVVGWLADQQNMLAIMDSGGDLHSATAEAITGKPVKGDSPERKLGKEANNALNYGMGALKFADRVFSRLGLILSEADAKKAVAAYFGLYPNIKAWHRKMEAEIYRGRRLETPHGRVRHFHSPLNYKMVQDALAYIPPSVVADTINLGWLDFQSKKGDLRVRVLQQCHDSLLLQVHKSDLDKAAELLLQCMEGITFTINGVERHFDAEISTGPNWGELQAYGKLK